MRVISISGYGLFKSMNKPEKDDGDGGGDHFLILFIYFCIDDNDSGNPCSRSIPSVADIISQKVLCENITS